MVPGGTRIHILRFLGGGGDRLCYKHFLLSDRHTDNQTNEERAIEFRAPAFQSRVLINHF